MHNNQKYKLLSCVTLSHKNPLLNLCIKRRPSECRHSEVPAYYFDISHCQIHTYFRKYVHHFHTRAYRDEHRLSRTKHDIQDLIRLARSFGARTIRRRWFRRHTSKNRSNYDIVFADRYHLRCTVGYIHQGDVWLLRFLLHIRLVLKEKFI